MLLGRIDYDINSGVQLLVAMSKWIYNYYSCIKNTTAVWNLTPP